MYVIHKHQPLYLFCMDSLQLYTVFVHVLVCLQAQCTE